MPNVMAALGIYRWCPQLKIIKSEFPFLVPCRKVWLTPTVPVPCGYAAVCHNRRTQDLDADNFAPGRILSGGRSPRQCVI